MKKKILFLLVLFCCIVSNGQDLTISGVYDGSLSGGTPKGIEIYVINNVTDLSIYGLGSANNGGGSDGEEFTFPAVSATSGDYIYISYESLQFTNFFGFAPNYSGVAVANINGDDAIELFMNGSVIDLYGNINVDGTGQAWEYLDGWAYRNAVGPSATFNLGDWVIMKDVLLGETTNVTSTTPMPIGTYGSSVLSVVKNQIENFTMYPNPVSNGNLFLSSDSREQKQVDIYALTGQRVYSTMVKSREAMDISNLNNGLYLVKIIEAGNISTRKLVVN